MTALQPFNTTFTKEVTSQLFPTYLYPCQAHSYVHWGNPAPSQRTGSPREVRAVQRGGAGARIKRTRTITGIGITWGRETAEASYRTGHAHQTGQTAELERRGRGRLPRPTLLTFRLSPGLSRRRPKGARRRPRRRTGPGAVPFFPQTRKNLI